ncbi:HlyD family secretion protein [Thalassoroseus pseudoceratinae]|uniref:HlyD family secretion protein n=1 Tax=Thalassoroseus pseudoceratinae TaxID=2713176 RepID=UPI00141E7152|nr:HlyD family efflux transporter periplasmic adaptor subunit [Thalassoroseus pseudoceratinae]
MSHVLRCLFVLVAVSILALGLRVLGQPPQTRESTDRPSVRLTPSQRAALERQRHRIVEAGVIESAKTTEFRSTLGSATTLISIVPDGTIVEKGTLLAVLDAAPLQQDLTKQRVIVNEAEDTLRNAEAEFQAARVAAEQDVPIAKLEVRVAELAKSRYLAKGGEFDCQLQKIREKVNRLTLKPDQQPDSKSSADQQSQEVTPHQKSAEQARVDLAAAQAEQRLLEEFIKPHQTATLELAVRKAKAKLQRLEQTAQKAIRDGESAVRKAESALKVARERVEKTQDEIQQTRILAPHAGVVVHVAPSTRRSAGPVLEPGATLQPRQLLLKMPDLSRLQARIGVHESQIARVKVGQAVSLQLDAFPNREFSGRVIEIDRTPQPQSWLTGNNGSTYGVAVEITEPSDAMKLGMTVAAEFERPTK